MTLKELYKKMQAGEIRLINNVWADYLTVDDDYIRFANYGSSAKRPSFDNFRWVAKHWFNCKTANQLLKHFGK